MSGPRWIWVLATFVLVAATQLTVSAVRALYEPRTVRDLKHALSECPETFGSWTLRTSDSRDADGIDPAILRKLNADELLERTYIEEAGRRCTVHIAVWKQPDGWMPHSPEVCYPAAGYALQRKRELQFPGSDDYELRSAEFVTPQDNIDVVALYWYQIGEGTFYNRDSARRVYRGLWGQPDRMPLVKVLIHYSNDDLIDTETKVLEVAQGLHDFVAEL